MISEGKTVLDLVIFVATSEMGVFTALLFYIDLPVGGSVSRGGITHQVYDRWRALVSTVMNFRVVP